MKTKLIIASLALMAVTTLASAQNRGAGQGQMNGKGNGIAFVDADKNSICDNYEKRSSPTATRPGTGRFNGARKGQRQGKGLAYGQCGMHQGRNKQNNFVDADKNGICDYRETTEKK